MSKELLEIQTGQFGSLEQTETIYQIVEPQTQRGGEPRVKVFDQNEAFIEEFASWTHMNNVFKERGWKVTDVTIWDDTDTFVGYFRQLQGQ